MRAKKVPRLNPPDEVSVHMREYMGVVREDFGTLADADVIVRVGEVEYRLPVHSHVMAQHSPVLLTACVIYKEQQQSAGRLELREIFHDMSLEGVKLFLACCYKFAKVETVLKEALASQPSGEWVQEAWVLAHALDAQEVSDAISSVIDGSSIQGNLVVWLETAEKCKCNDSMEELVLSVAERICCGKEDVMADFLAGCGRLKQETSLAVLKAVHKLSSQMMMWEDGHKKQTVEWVTEAVITHEDETDVYALSPPFKVGEHMWRVRLDVTGQGSTDEMLGLVLHLDSPPGNVVEAKYSLKLMHWGDDRLSIATQSDGFAEFEGISVEGWGLDDLCPMSQVRDPRSGFLREGKVKIQVTVELKA